ncbi:ExeM/NucH family extracellular endonuclease [Thalassotalea sp. 1_MG-2023]|uniref:ExeM/NucH family extracellular endonuclease n=1 Tax=Thalassotalea sp. 1_MG-2023 TaxID=3062680 RepID=UPI0026E23B4F|nr:ExeM/NucH family extracellular endonuclease [Thalassotalea sp. 1_MG-2023]MDO6428830.1 ExeM/NucH family extracellular endonuclease [Thalassotalea sp. 1_MG-2023]
MKKIPLLTLSALLSTTASADIIISEYVEGSSYNKAVELFNTSDQTVDLSQYQLALYFNGNSTAGNTINLNGTIAAKSTFVIAHRDIDNSVTTQLSTGSLLFNGDDAIVLKKANVVVDSIGKVGQDPGSEWGNSLTSTKDNTLVRKSFVSSGDTNPNDEFNPADQWIGFAKNTLDSLGSHQFDGSSDNGDPGDGDNGDGDTPATGTCGDSYTSIANIQGSSNSTPLSGETVWTEGIVTHSLQHTGYKGFFIQSADLDTDNNAMTSEGIFVYHQADTVTVGDKIRLQASVSEYNDLTQLATVTELHVCQTAVSLPTAKHITLPLNATQREALEGMRVTVENSIVTDTYNYGRYGQFEVASERLYTPTQVTEPGVSANQLALENAEKSIMVDDGETAQNPEMLPAPTPELSAINSLRSGDTIPTLTGILSFHFNQYQILQTSPVATITTNARQLVPNLSTLGNLRVASFNVLNYFNGNGLGDGFPTARGAMTEAEFVRQRNKIIAAIAAIDADVIGLMEIENDGYDQHSAIADLTQGLNDHFNENVYHFIAPAENQMGTDEIAVGMLYKTNSVTPIESAKVLNSQNSATDENGQVLFLSSKNRPVITQKFKHQDSAQSVVIAVNHFKSKGSSCNSLGDYDNNDGQGNCNLTRTRAAQALGLFLNKEYGGQPTLVIGDLNAYLKEDPIVALANAGFDDLFSTLNKTNAYSYIFNGQLGQLDHALANQALAQHVVDVITWPINADEPRVLDYSMQYQNATHHAKFYAPDAFRSSDHDPIIVEISLSQNDIFGDLDQDADVDTQDITLFLRLAASNELTDLAYDFNNDKQLDRRDVRGYMQLCTRTRCATE